jgi:signal transduction histidine kinase
MRAPDDAVPPQRPALERILIRSWEYRHLRFWGGLRFGAGIALFILAVLTLGLGGTNGESYAWAAAFLALGAVNLALGYWQITVAYRLMVAPLPRRVQELEQSRARVVDDSAARLRRIERDLHDGAQTQMVAVTMKLGLAVKKLRGMSGGAGQADLDRVLELVATAHSGAKEAVAELRDLCRGIHPTVLDQGLGVALTTLAGHSDLPVELAVDLPGHPSAALETMAYFCAAELLTNAAKHSGARHVTLEAVHLPGLLLRVRVTDDGCGGARMDARGGLAGLAERISAVDGTMQLSSPPGGPTVATVELPAAAGATEPEPG